MWVQAWDTFSWARIRHRNFIHYILTEGWRRRSQTARLKAWPALERSDNVWTTWAPLPLTPSFLAQMVAKRRSRLHSHIAVHLLMPFTALNIFSWSCEWRDSLPCWNPSCFPTLLPSRGDIVQATCWVFSSLEILWVVVKLLHCQAFYHLVWFGVGWQGGLWLSFSSTSLEVLKRWTVTTFQGWRIARNCWFFWANLMGLCEK